MPTAERERVLSVKRGDVPRDEVSEQITDIEHQVRALLDRDETPLPDHADLQAISQWAVDAQRKHWKWA